MKKEAKSTGSIPGSGIFINELVLRTEEASVVIKLKRRSLKNELPRQLLSEEVYG